MRRPSTKKTEELGVLAVQRIINNMNCQFVSYSPDISGFDGEIQLTEPSGELSSQLLKCQVKSGPSYITGQSERYLSVRIRSSYFQMWLDVNQPVILFYHDVASDTVYWLSIKDYMKEPGVVRNPGKTTVVTFDKANDVFTEDSYDRLRATSAGILEYGSSPELRHDVTESLYLNWFPVREFPSSVYVSPTPARDKKSLPRRITDRHALALKEGRLFSYLDPRSDELLAAMVTQREVQQVDVKDVARVYVVELLNSAFHVAAIARGLRRLRTDEPKYGFPLEVLRNHNPELVYETLGGRKTKRQLVYVYRRHGDPHVEYRRHALSASFVETPAGWFLELDPYMDYTYRPSKSPRETGAAITKGIQATFNYQYLLMLRLWQQFLSGGTGEVRIRTDVANDSPEIIVHADAPRIDAQFGLTSDPFAGDLK